MCTDHEVGKMTNAIWWIRRDMRIADNKALVAAASNGDVIPLFVLDPTLWQQLETHAYRSCTKTCGR